MRRDPAGELGPPSWASVDKEDDLHSSTAAATYVYFNINDENDVDISLSIIRLSCALSAYESVESSLVDRNKTASTLNLKGS